MGRVRVVRMLGLTMIPARGPMSIAEPVSYAHHGGHLESWWNLCTEGGNRRPLRKTRSRNRSPSMPTTPLPPEKQAEIEGLEQAIREAVEAEIGELAANLATSDDAHLFGANEFKIRALAHKIAAKAMEQHLARKKTATRAPQ